MKQFKILVLFYIIFSFKVNAQSEWNYGLGLEAYKNSSSFRSVNVQGYLKNTTYINNTGFFPSGHLFAETPEMLIKNVTFEFLLGYFYRNKRNYFESKHPGYFDQFDRGIGRSVGSSNFTVRTGFRVNYKLGKYVKIFAVYEPHFHGSVITNDAIWNGIQPRERASEGEIAAFEEFKDWGRTANERDVTRVQHNLAYGVELRYWRFGLSYTRMYAQNDLLQDFEFDGVVLSDPGRLNSKWLALRYYWK
ncbi:MAG: hypothetical protein LAT68_05350 [Cyclobacteriaceae bacterium]|nr:hypothetical protein [Cyclobacteriaceae bacterium]MCH8515736.1 hypothetical protein [Cyclobacteriaceae bacterium]